MEDTTIEDVLKTVQNYYAQKDYNLALDTLLKNQEHVPPGIWHYNVGTVHGKLENWPLARFHLLMAGKEGYVSQEAIQNRELVEEKLNVGRLEIPTSASDYFFKYSLEATHGVFTTMGLLLIISGIIALWKKVSAKVTILFFLTAVMIFGFNWWLVELDKNIIVNSQIVHEGPSAIFESSEELPAGVMVITVQSGEWLKIIYPSRFQGWIKKSGLKELR